ncbi:MAG: DNA polymerase IV [Nocardioidaceae bacterium]
MTTTPEPRQRWVLHVDLDQFLAAVEVLRHPELRGKPVIVGGKGDPTQRAVVSTASYEAREYGVRSGMALRTAARKCPDAVFLPVDEPAYLAVSEQVMNTLRSFPAAVEVLGWDEAFMEPVPPPDDPEAFARDVQRAVREATQLSCAVGIGDNKLRAKIATEFGKPGGTFRLTDDNWYPVMADRPTDALWGIGRKTAKRLAGMGIETVRDLALTDPQVLADEIGPTMGPWLRMTSRGVDNSPVDARPWVARSHGREETFQQDLTEWEEVREQVRRLAAHVVDDVLADQRMVMRVAVKVRYVPFFTYTRSRTLAEPTTELQPITEAALEALERLDRRDPIRLLGVRADMTPVEPD